MGVILDSSLILQALHVTYPMKNSRDSPPDNSSIRQSLSTPLTLAWAGPFQQPPNCYPSLVSHRPLGSPLGCQSDFLKEQIMIFTHSRIWSFCFVNTFYVPGTILASENTTMSKGQKRHHGALHSKGERPTDTKTKCEKDRESESVR